MRHLWELDKHPEAIPIEMERCRRSAVYWFNNWVWTYDPRAALELNPDGSKRPAHLPLDLWLRQEQMIQFIEARVLAREDGLIEKSRDIGFTWCAGGFALHKWLFFPGFKSAFGSRKEEYVDKIGEPDSIFEKIRMMLRSLPAWMHPLGFNAKGHDMYMRLINPVSGNIIRGEAGDQMGRGGRSSAYFIDEAAHLEHGDLVDAATSATSDVRIWGSSVNGMGNIFAKKRHGGALRPDQIFRFHYTDDPRKTPEWAEKKKRTMEPHVWAAEYDIDYSASVEGICIPGNWVMAAVSLGQRGLAVPSTKGCAGLDIGAGKARSVWVPKFGAVVGIPVSWGDPDSIETAIRAVELCRDTVIHRPDGYDCTVGELYYDSPGVGFGVQSALRHHAPQALFTVPVNTGVAPTERVWPDGQTSVEKFLNLKAELWFVMRERFKCAYELLLFLDGLKGGIEHSIEDCIVFPSLTEGSDVQALVGQLSLVRWFRNEKGKIQMEKKDQLAQRGISSPDYADALALAHHEGGLSVWEKMAA